MKRPWIPLLAVAALAAGCEKSVHNMYDQPKFKPLTATTLFEDGNASRPQVTGTVPYSNGALAGSSSGRQGREPDVGTVPGAASGFGAAISLPLLARGRERYDIFCAPCHSPAGDGDGMVVRRGFPAPPSFHLKRLREAPDSHFYEVITQGYGLMSPYAERISTADRWAIVAYLRALQLSQSAPIELLQPEDLRRLKESER